MNLRIPEKHLNHFLKTSGYMTFILVGVSFSVQFLKCFHPPWVEKMPNMQNLKKNTYKWPLRTTRNQFSLIAPPLMWVIDISGSKWIYLPLYTNIDWPTVVSMPNLTRPQKDAIVAWFMMEPLSARVHLRRGRLATCETRLSFSKMAQDLILVAVR